MAKKRTVLLLLALIILIGTIFLYVSLTKGNEKGVYQNAQLVTGPAIDAFWRTPVRWL